VRAIRALIAKHGGHMEILSKIENLEGVKNFDAILAESDGVMVARGDLGVEIPAEDVPLIQKEIIAKCNRAGKPVIVATQMLESMTTNPRPTRAEASDVANAILDGTDAIMLSGETAGGDYPVEAVETMARIAERTERALSYREIIESAGVERHKTTEAIAHATVQLAYELGAKLIITPTTSGYTTRMVSKYRPKAEIFAFTDSEQVARHLNLRWGVEPAASSSPWKDAEEMADMAAAAAKERGLVAAGDRTVVTSGIRLGEGNTNAIRVYTVE
jgi:pyruvate kinase